MNDITDKSDMGGLRDFSQEDNILSVSDRTLSYFKKYTKVLSIVNSIAHYVWTDDYHLAMRIISLL